MASITLKNIPPELHRALKARAREQGRSLNQEALWLLRTAAMAPVLGREEAESWFAHLAARHQRQAAEGVWVRDEDLTGLKRQGRP